MTEYWEGPTADVTYAEYMRTQREATERNRAAFTGEGPLDYYEVQKRVTMHTLYEPKPWNPGAYFSRDEVAFINAVVKRQSDKVDQWFRDVFAAFEEAV